MPKFPATVTMAAEGGWPLRRVYIVNRQLSRALVAQRVPGRWSLRFLTLLLDNKRACHVYRVRLREMRTSNYVCVRAYVYERWLRNNFSVIYSVILQYALIECLLNIPPPL